MITGAVQSHKGTFMERKHALPENPSGGGGGFSPLFHACIQQILDFKNVGTSVSFPVIGFDCDTKARFSTNAFFR
jgi:hypothetical protein